LSKPFAQRIFELLSRLSLRGLYRLGRAAAFIVARTPNQVSRQARQNIELSFPELSKAERKQLFHESIRHTCYAGIELAAIWCWPVDKVEAHITEVDVCDSFMQTTRGRIILLPHLGSWETLGVWLGQRINVMYLYKRRKNKSIDQFVKASRSRTGGVPVPTKKAGLRKLLVGLKRGDSLVILPDQKPSSNKARIESTFFGQSAPTTTLVQNLCSKLDCDVFVAMVYRTTPLGELGISIEPLDRERLAGDEVESANYMNDQIEQRVRRHKEQYLWAYRRFSNQAYESVS
jgi:KDO2-lipid IV(A) lauroyltransferase